MGAKERHKSIVSRIKELGFEIDEESKDGGSIYTAFSKKGSPSFFDLTTKDGKTILSRITYSGWDPIHQAPEKQKKDNKEILTSEDLEEMIGNG